MRLFGRVWSPRAAATTLAITLAIVGSAVFLVGYRDRQRPPPTPPVAAAGRIAPRAEPTTTAAPRLTRSASTTTTTIGIAPSPPVEITIPSIGVQSTIVNLGRNADGTVEVPSSFHVAGWYQYSVTPGQDGPSVYLGHVDSVSGPGIFYRLGDVHPGDHVLVKRQDGRTITFVVTGVRKYSKTAFPTLDVYANTPVPTIRLVTCGGAFDTSTRHYLSNIVAFGQLA